MEKARNLKSDVMRARVDPTLKAHAETVFHALGLTTSQAITLFLKQVELHKGMPFPVNIPNAETARVLKNSEKGIDIIETNDLNDLFNQLDLDKKE